MQGEPGSRCSCGQSFDSYTALAQHVRLYTLCPACAAPAVEILGEGVVDRWTCGHWIASGDFSAALREAGEVLDHYPTYGADREHLACACGHAERINSEDIGDALARLKMHVRAARQAGDSA